MAFPKNESSLQFATAKSVKDAFAKLKGATVVKRRAVSPGALPFDGTLEAGHIQGVAITGKRIAITTSADPGHIMLGERFSTGYGVFAPETINGLGHPGGIQAIGRFLAIPVYRDADQRTRQKKLREVQIRDIEKELADGSVERELEPLHRIKMGRKSFCIGIADMPGPDGDCYVLTVVVKNDGDRIWFYRSKPNVPLSNPAAFAGPHAEPVLKWDKSDLSDAQRKALNFRGYANNISLIAGKDGSLFLAGFHNSSLTGVGGTDRVDLFEVALGGDPAKALTRADKWKVDTSSKVSFRWGASLYPVSGSLALIASEKRVGGDSNSIELNYVEG